LEPSPILGKRTWGRRALALPWPRAQVIGIDVSTTGIRQPRKLKSKLLRRLRFRDGGGWG
jgi:hypothetical protein